MYCPLIWQMDQTKFMKNIIHEKIATERNKMLPTPSHSQLSTFVPVPYPTFNTLASIADQCHETHSTLHNL